MKKYDVQCPFCNGTFHETNGRFDPDKPAKGNMFDTKQHVKDAGWSTFPPYDSTEYQNLVCPSCDQPYVDSTGRVIRLREIGEVEPVVDAPVQRPAGPQEPIADVMARLMAEYDPDVPEPTLVDEQTARAEFPGTQYAEAEPAPLAEPEPAPKKRQPRKKADA